jgi:hypothetical protein
MATRRNYAASQVSSPPTTAPTVESWTQSSPVGQWPVNVAAQYAVTFFNLSGETALGPWGDLGAAPG